MPTYQCSGCGKSYDVPPEMLGRRVRCKVCGTVGRVPPSEPRRTPPPLPSDTAPEEAAPRWSSFRDWVLTVSAIVICATVGVSAILVARARRAARLARYEAAKAAQHPQDRRERAEAPKAVLEKTLGAATQPSSPPPSAPKVEEAQAPATTPKPKPSLAPATTPPPAKSRPATGEQAQQATPTPPKWQDIMRAVVVIRGPVGHSKESLGSGFFISADGLVATCYHVVSEVRQASVTLKDGTVLPVLGLVASDPEADLAILKVGKPTDPLPFTDVPGPPFKFLPLGPPILPPIGAEVYAIGSPKGLANTLSKGIVSAHRKMGANLALIQITAPVSPGSSGGPLVSEDGLVVGVIAATMLRAQNINFAIPVSLLRPLVQSAGPPTELPRVRKAKTAFELISLASMALGNGDYDRALRLLDQATRADPNCALAWWGKALALAELGRIGEALECYDRALQINPKLAGAWENKGEALGKLGRYAEALECFDRAIQINRKDAVSWFNKGVALAELRRWTEALESFDRAIQINPKLAEAWLGKGSALLELGRPAEALECCDRAIRIDPKYAKGWYNKGVALGKLGRYTEALECCDRAIRINPKLAEAWLGKGVVAYGLGRFREARRCFETAARLGDRNAAKALREWRWPDR